jgi:hypothetical protein
MKKSLIAIMLLVSTIAAAAEITKEEYLELWDKNKSTYENVEVGMTAEYQSTYISENEDGSENKCEEHLKEVVISTDHSDKYLIYKRVTAMSDCSYQKKGEFTEELRWRKLYFVGSNATVRRSSLEYKKITLNGSISTAEATRTYFSNNMTEEFKIQIDHSKSQFFSMIEGKWGKDTERLLRRSITDTSSLKLENLEINDVELQD